MPVDRGSWREPAHTAHVGPCAAPPPGARWSRGCGTFSLTTALWPPGRGRRTAARRTLEGRPTNLRKWTFAFRFSGFWETDDDSESFSAIFLRLST